MLTMSHGDLGDAISLCFELSIYFLGILRFIVRINTENFISQQNLLSENFLDFRKYVSTMGVGWSTFEIAAYYASLLLARKLETILTVIFILCGLCCVALMLYDINNFGKPVGQSWLLLSINSMLVGIPTAYAFSLAFAYVVHVTWPRGA